MFSFSSERSLLVFFSWEFISSICLFQSFSSLFAALILAEKTSIRIAMTAIAPKRVRTKASVDIDSTGAEPAGKVTEPAYSIDGAAVATAVIAENRVTRRGKFSAMHLWNLPMKNIRLRPKLTFNPH